jgi:Ca2+-binding RTX toxin-like protein
MGYSVSLASSTSQAEGQPGGGATFTFNLTRDLGDQSETAYRYKVFNAADMSPANDFTTSDQPFTWALNTASTSVTITAVGDTTIEANENFVVWFYRDDPALTPAQRSSPFFQSTTITLTNDDAGPPVFSSADTVSVAENQTAVLSVAATGSGTVTYSIDPVTGGDDRALFSINSSSGALTFIGAPNYDAPADVGANNVYNVNVTATAGGQSTTQAVAVTVTNVYDVAPDITSNGGLATATINLVEGQTTVTTGVAADPEPDEQLTWSIAGGADASRFQVNASTGVLSFVTAPDFEQPTDSGANNSYEVTLRVTDKGNLTNDQAITVNVTNNANEGAVFTSYSGQDFVLLSAPENTATTTVIATVAAKDGDGTTPTYVLGGNDASRFAVNASGQITFSTSPNYEAPGDASGDNVYELTVTANDGDALSTDDTQSFYISVTNVIESGVPSDQNPTTPPPAGGGPNNGTSGSDNFPGTVGNDSYAGGDAADTINGGDGSDWLDGDNGNDQITGGSGDDFIRGLADDDFIDGGDGFDDVNGNIGADTVSGGEGSDTVRGGQNADIVSGDGGNDAHVNGNLGDDTVRGGDGSDSVYGGQGSDQVYGDSGDDRVSGDLGNDLLYGGSGADRFAFAVGGGQDWVGDFNFSEGDRILLAPGTAYTMVNHNGQVMISLGNGDVIGLAGVSTSGFSADWIIFG